jgi:8-oxo-dGTP pyrophosphatase MutT (NUDIX family)
MITADFRVIAVAVIRRGNEILLGKKVDRPHPEGLSGKWFFPGGVVDKGETLEEALKREMREEIGAEIEVNELIGVGQTFCPNWKGKRLYAVEVYFECFTKTDKFKPSDDIVDVKWVKGKEIWEYVKDMEHLIPNNLKKYLDKLGWK